MAEMKATTRQGIPHLFAPGNVMQMKADEFLKVIKWMDEKGGIVNPEDYAFSEKADGFAIRFGLDVDGRFFIESARSGPVYNDGAFSEFAMAKKGKPDDISKGYDDILKQLKNNKSLLDILKKNNKNGIKVIAESFYLPNGVVNPTDKDLIKFIATYYKKSLIGSWASFILFDVIDSEGNSLDNADEIIQKIKSLSNEHVIFDDSKLKSEQQINFTKEIKDLKVLLNKLESESSRSISDIVNDPNRTKDAQAYKKMVKGEIEKFQEKLSNKLKGLIGAGKWGPNLEGLVFKLGNDILFKVVTDSFKDAKKEFNKELKKPTKESINFKTYTNRVLRG